jgi:hypothetical protein
MGLVFTENFASYDDVNKIATKWTARSGGILTTVDGYNVWKSQGERGYRIYKNPLPEMSSFVTGMKLQWIGRAGETFQLGRWGQYYCNIYTSANTIYTRIGSSYYYWDDVYLIKNKWHNIEIKWTISDSIAANDCVIKMDNKEVLNLAAGTDTKIDANTTVNHVHFGTLSGTAYPANFYVTDIYIIDQTDGVVPSGTLGPQKITTLFPNAAGNANNFVNNSGDAAALNFNYVKERSPDDETSFIGSAGAGVIDLYNIEQPSSGHYLETDYNYQQSFWGENPNTTSAWTQTELNTLEIGVKKQ